MQAPKTTPATQTVYFVNPRSGGGRGAALLLETQWGTMVEIEPARISAQLAAHVHRHDRVVVAGGDGTFSLVIDALFKKGLQDEVSLFLLPFGTGNDLARSLGIPLLTPAELADPWHQRFERVQLPIWRYGDRHFVNYVSWGMDAKMLREVERYRKVFPSNVALRKLAFTTAGLRHLVYAVQSPCFVEIDGERHALQGKVGVIISNLPYYAGGSPISTIQPAADCLSVTLVNSAWDMLRLGFSRHQEQPKPVLSFQRARRVRLIGPELPMQIDGEVGTHREATIELAGRIGIWVPKPT